MASPRVYVAATLISMLVWQIYAIASLFRDMPLFEGTWADFGGELPAISRLLADTYEASAALPIVSVGLVWHALWRTPLSYVYAGAIFVFMALSTLALDYFATEAFFAPIRQIAAALE